MFMCLWISCECVCVMACLFIYAYVMAHTHIYVHSHIPILICIYDGMYTHTHTYICACVNPQDHPKFIERHKQSEGKVVNFRAVKLIDLLVGLPVANYLTLRQLCHLLCEV
jgi:hypothetical protein